MPANSPDFAQVFRNQFGTNSSSCRPPNSRATSIGEACQPPRATGQGLVSTARLGVSLALPVTLAAAWH